MFRLGKYRPVQEFWQYILGTYCEGNAWLTKVDLADPYCIVTIQKW